MPVNHVESEEDGNLQPRFFHCLPLQLVALVRAGEIEDRAESAPRGKLVLIDLRSARPGGRAVGELRQLAEFFGECHPLQKRRHFRVDFCRFNHGRTLGSCGGG